MMIKEIRRERFEALSYGRVHLSSGILQEVEWYSSDSEALLGIVVLDLIDFDHGFVVLGRDETGIFRAIETGHSFESKQLARSKLREEIIRYEATGDLEFPQGDRKAGRQLLLEPVTSMDKLHNHFKVLITKEGYSCAKEIITEIAYAFNDPDGNYIQQFQTTGFNSRLWELFLFALFHEEKFVIHRAHTAPDFHIEKFGVSIFVEAVTVNPGLDMPSEPSSNEDIFYLLKDFVPIKFSSSLCAKLNRGNKAKYWELGHVKGHPFVLAIHDYLYDNSMTWTRTALETYLYGYHHEATRDQTGRIHVKATKVERHIWKEKNIVSGFFNLPDSENVSAVLFTNTATLSTFNRMGFLAEFGDPNVRMTRSGTAYDTKTQGEVSFVKKVIKDRYKETWGEGVAMYHNPKALIPVDEELFPNIAHMKQIGGEWLVKMPDFYPLDSVTSIIVMDKEKRSRK